MKNIGLFTSIFLMLSICRSQELPPIEYFSADRYNAENQNWDLSQDENKFIYAANNKGLLKYNGATWQLYPSPNQTIVRSVLAIEDRIYIGCYMEFGFWSENVEGNFTYTSLTSKLEKPLIEDEQFWQIESSGNRVLFRSLNRIYIYNPESETFKIINSESIILRIFNVNDTIYFQNSDEGIFRFENGSAKLIYTNEFLQNHNIINFFKIDDDFVFVTQNNGLFYLGADKVLIQKQSIDNNFHNITIYSAIKLTNNTIVIGTVGSGIFQITKNGDIIKQLDQSKGIGNNTALSLLEDASGNVWLGLDNGITVINLHSRYSIYKDDQGFLGTIYTSLDYNGLLYIGTNQGLFYKTLSTEDDFELIDGTQGQVWFLKEVNGTIFCGHNIGTFIVKGKRAELTIEELGAWDIMPLNDSLALQGNFTGLNILKKVGDSWILRNKIEDFDISSRDFEIIDNEIIINHEYKGIYKIEVDESFTRTLKVSKIKNTGKNIHSGLTKYNGSILYSNRSGIFKYDPSIKRFKKDISLSKLYTAKEYLSGKLIIDKEEQLWCFTESDIRYLSPNSLSADPIISKIPIPHNVRKEMIGFENILNMGGGSYFYGTSKGYFKFDLEDRETEEYEIFLNDINIYNRNQNKLNFDKSEIIELDHQSNNVKFIYSIPEYGKYSNAEYRYMLSGYNNRWSEWTNGSSVYFKNLNPGEYIFKLEGRVAGNVLENSIDHAFTIQKPWYNSNLMKAFYIVLVLLISVAIHLLYSIYYSKQQKLLLLRNQRQLALREMEFEQQRMSLENEKLQHDIENKNRELAISTMSLIKKNEFLSEIKKELSGSQVDLQSNKKVLKIIDKKLDTDDDWKFFEEAFNNADKDFIKAIKSRHPSLTPSDLRLCAYLRLNLSSKEIAPLLNITYRSIEIKRYRLRKKMELEHKTSLTEYILSF